MKIKFTGMYIEDDNFCPFAWRMALILAFNFGWKPAGTTLTNSDGNKDEKWDGGYFSSSYQRVSDDDAKNLSKALYSAVRAIENKTPLPKDAKQAMDDEYFCLATVLRIAKIASDRGFHIR